MPVHAEQELSVESGELRPRLPVSAGKNFPCRVNISTKPCRKRYGEDCGLGMGRGMFRKAGGRRRGVVYRAGGMGSGGGVSAEDEEWLLCGEESSEK
mmetsp:Transcript_19626/g.52183  ORF Transcript_19626/g.52183 Transcript_19626/m.52183 type:complete len:97 (-) Transcript_19626:114-404(-)